MKERYPEKFQRKGEELNTEDLNETNEMYFDMQTCRDEMQEFEFEEEFYKRMMALFGRKLAFSNK